MLDVSVQNRVQTIRVIQSAQKSYMSKSNDILPKYYFTKKVKVLTVCYYKVLKYQKQFSQIFSILKHKCSRVKNPKIIYKL